MSCHKIRTLLSRRLDETLDDDESAALATHLATCSTCADVARDLQTSMQLLRSTVAGAGDAALVQAVMGAVDTAAAALIDERDGLSEDELFRRAMLGVAAARGSSIRRLAASHVAVALLSAAAVLMFLGHWDWPGPGDGETGELQHTAGSLSQSDEAAPPHDQMAPPPMISGEAPPASAANTEDVGDESAGGELPSAVNTGDARAGEVSASSAAGGGVASTAELSAQGDRSDNDSLAVMAQPTQNDTPPRSAPLFVITVDTAPFAAALDRLELNIADWLGEAADRAASHHAAAQQLAALESAAPPANVTVPGEVSEVSEPRPAPLTSMDSELVAAGRALERLAATRTAAQAAARDVLQRKALSAPVTVLRDGPRLLLTMRGPPALVVPSLLDLLVEDEPRIVDMALAELEGIRTDIEADPALHAAVLEALEGDTPRPLPARLFGKDRGGRDRHRDQPTAEAEDPAGSWNRWWAAASPHLAVTAF